MNETSALPGGQNASGTAFSNSASKIPLSTLLGLELPSKDVCDFLLEIYIESVHWFMMVFHEPSFRRRYNLIVESGYASQSDIHFLSLVMLVLAMGARYVTNEAARERASGTNLEELQLILLAKVRENLFEIFDEGIIESVQVCVLLSSFYLYHGRPNLAFIVLGSGVRCAQAIGLHQESTWRVSSVVEREVRRRVWLAVYVFDR